MGGQHYYSVGKNCRPNENCGPSSSYKSSVDFLSIPEIQAMLRRGRNQQRSYYRPFLDEIRYTNRMDRPFDSASSIFSPWKSRSIDKTVSPPRYDITEKDHQIQIDIDVPGIAMNNINISLDDQTNVLSVTGSREAASSSFIDANEGDERSAWSKKSTNRKFSQKFVLRNPTIDINQISASLENGVLTITLPKITPKDEVQEINVRQIPIVSTKSTTNKDISTINDVDDPNKTNSENSVTDSIVTMSEGGKDQSNIDTTLNNGTDDSEPNPDDSRIDDK